MYFSACFAGAKTDFPNHPSLLFSITFVLHPCQRSLPSHSCSQPVSQSVTSMMVENIFDSWTRASEQRPGYECMANALYYVWIKLQIYSISSNHHLSLSKNFGGKELIVGARNTGTVHKAFENLGFWKLFMSSSFHVSRFLADRLPLYQSKGRMNLPLR